MARHETVTASVHVERPPTEVFDYLADVARHVEWSPKAYRVEGVAVGHQVTEGKRFTSYGWLPGDKDHRNDVEVTAVQAPSGTTWQATSPRRNHADTVPGSPLTRSSPRASCAGCHGPLTWRGCPSRWVCR